MSGGGMPELGSKISLISKADIRYEGRLYTVDPQECTIALSSVRSFGTEDRETQFQIAPQSQIYDYILFRGSDIKDIRVVNNNLPHPNDPAIMQVHMPNGQHLMPHFPMANMNAPHPPQMSSSGGAVYPFGLGNAGGGLANLTGGSGGGGAAPPSLAPGSNAPGSFMHMGGNQQQQQQQQQVQPQKTQQQQQKQPISVIDMLAGASRSTTPISLISRKSPTDLVNQQQQMQQQLGGGSGRDAGHKRQSQPRGGGLHNNNTQPRNHNDYNNYNHPHQQHNNRDRRDSGRAGGSGGGPNMDGNQYNSYQRNNHPGGQNRGWNMHRGGPQNATNMMRNRNSSGRGRIQSQGYRPLGGGPGLGGNHNKPRTGRNTIKFEQDFDFEQANNKFEELRSQLAKLKVGDEAKSSEQLDTAAATTNLQMNGEVDKKDDSGNETGAGEHEPEDEEIHVGYDKAKSFFDNISCEAAQDRTKNKKNDWRKERKLNSETFGVSSTRRGSGYRGRGGYYDRNTGNYIPENGGIGGGGGRFNRNYRGGNNNNYRNRSNNRNNTQGNHNLINSNSANNHNHNGGSSAVALKQAQQHPLASNDEKSETTNTTTTTKTTTLQENNTQPQVAPVGQ